MADVAIDSAIATGSESPHQGATAFMQVAVSDTVIYQFYFPSTVLALAYKKSGDGGATWGSVVNIATDAAESPVSPCVWYDKWTPGDTGTLIHIVFLNDDTQDIKYCNLDTATDTLSGIVVVSALAVFAVAQSVCYISKARGGNLYIAYSITAAVHDFYRSVDGGVNWTNRLTPFEGDIDDAVNCVLLPGGDADNQDMWMVYADQSASAVTLKKYDNSADTWPTEIAVGAATIAAGVLVRQVSAAIRNSDNHAIIVINTVVDNAAADLLAFDFDGTTANALTNIITDIDDWTVPVVCIDQNSDDIYVAWLGNPSGADTWTATVNPWWTVSTDGGSTWATSLEYAEGTEDDYRALFCSPSTPGAAAGIFLLAWQDDDDNDLWTNAVNAVVLAVGGTLHTITPSGAIVPAGALVKLPAKLFAGTVTPAGLLLRLPMKTLAGAVIPAGSIVKDTSKPLGGEIEPAGALDLLRLQFLALSGAIVSAGQLLKSTAKAVAGALTPAGLLTKSTDKQFAGEVEPTGELVAIRLFVRIFEGVITPAGDLVKDVMKSLAGSVTPGGTIGKLTIKLFSGGVTPEGALDLVKVVLMTLEGAITPVGTLAKDTARVLVGAITPTGSLAKLFSTSFSGAIGFAGSLVRTAELVFAGAIALAGSLVNVLIAAPVIPTQLSGRLRNPLREQGSNPVDPETFVSAREENRSPLGLIRRVPLFRRGRRPMN